LVSLPRAATGFFTLAATGWRIIIGYARVSTTEQTLGFQHDEPKPATEVSLDAPNARRSRDGNGRDGKMGIWLEEFTARLIPPDRVYQRASRHGQAAFPSFLRPLVKVLERGVEEYPAISLRDDRRRHATPTVESLG
jgi:hypothetical protein